MSTIATDIWGITDPISRGMADGTIRWGDLLELCPEECARSIAFHRQFDAEERLNAEPSRELEYGWDFEYPELRLRKDIWEHFPVTVTPLGRGADGGERHAVAWHRAKLAEWRETKPESFCEWMDYEMDTEHRLFKCLESSKYWTVEESTADGQLCVIRMNFAPREEITAPIAEVSTAEEADSDDEAAFIAVFAKKAAPKATAAPAPAAAAAKPTAPLFTRLNDIKEHFPVVWHKVEEARTRTAVYALEIFGKKLAEEARAAGRPTEAYRADVERRLDVALRASPAWRVLRAEGREFCRLEMA